MEEVNSIHNKPNENDDNKQQQKQRSEQSLDPLGYTQQQSQTSEIFKIEINNLPVNIKYQVGENFHSTTQPINQ